MSSSRKELSIQKRSSIITLAKEGYSMRQIVTKTKIPKSTAHDTMKKLRDTDTFEYKKRTGRPKKTTEHEDRYIQTISKRNRRMTATEIAAEVNKDREDPIGTTTVKRRLLQAGLRGCVAVKKPLLKDQNKKKRLQWAKLYKDYTAEDWEKVLWTDESKFEVFGTKRRVHMRRKETEKFIPDCIVPTVQHGCQSVMV
ncbi:Transposable element Tc1 transposase [Anthophora quadrimaculata]